MSKPSKLDQLKGTVVAEGYVEGTQAFEKRLLHHKVLRCRELQGVGICSACPAYDHCETVKEYMRSQYNPKPARRPRDKDSHEQFG